MKTEQHKRNNACSLRYYYKNREKKIAYQREYDKKNKDKKAAQDKKRYGTEKYNRKQRERAYSQKHHLPKLIKKYGSCQLKLWGCLNNKKLEVHHKKYNKKIEDCLLLCQNCHKVIHRKSTYNSHSK